MGCTSSQEQKTPAGKTHKVKGEKPKCVIYELPADNPPSGELVRTGSVKSASNHAFAPMAHVASSQMHDLDMSVLPFEPHTKPPEEWTTWCSAFTEKYEMKSEVGQGQYATVWKADVRPDVYARLATLSNGHHVHRHAAVKVVQRERVDPVYWQQTKDEAKLLSQFRHPNIVELIEAYETPDTLLLVTQLCRGGEVLCSVTEHVQIYSEVACAGIIASVLAGVSYLHGLGFMHRDLKPANLIFKHRLKNLAGVQMKQKRMAIEESHVSQTFGDDAVPAAGSPSANPQDNPPAFKKLGQQKSQSIAIGEEVKFEVCQRVDSNDGSPTTPFAAVARQTSNSHLARGNLPQSKECKFHVQRGHHHAQHVKCDEKQELFLTQLKNAMLKKHDHGKHPEAPSKHTKVGMVNSDVVICDFSHCLHTNGGKITSVDGLVCSELFAAPELLAMLVKAGNFSTLPGAELLSDLPEPVGHYSEKCDIWSIGIVAYMLLTGVHPVLPQIEASDHCMVSIINGIIRWERPPTGAESWKKVSEDAKDFVTRCLQRNPESRPSAQELLQHEWITSRKARCLQDSHACKNIMFEAAIQAMAGSERQASGRH